MWMKIVLLGLVALAGASFAKTVELPQVSTTCLKVFPHYPYIPIFATKWPEGTIIGDTAPAKNMFAVKAENWLQPDAEFERKLPLRRALYLDNPGEVFAVHPDYKQSALRAGTELLKKLAGHLTEHFPSHYRLHLDAVEIAPLKLKISLGEDGIHPLVKCGLLIQDDITLSFKSPQGGYVLGAGFLSTPSDWSLTQKLGKSPLQIHETVPGYADKIAKMVDGLFRSISPDKIHGRNNWKLYTDPTESISLWRASQYTGVEVTAANVAHAVYLRTEWQTLIRLPESEAVAFTIRPRTFRLPHLKQIAPAVALQIAAALKKGETHNGLHDEWAGLVGDYLSRPD